MAKLAPTEFEQLRSRLLTARDYKLRIGHNTRAYLDGFGGTSHVNVVYHTTRIVSMGHAHDGTLYATLDSGGWQTSTTKARMNAFAHQIGWSVYQRDFSWSAQYIAHGWDGPAVPFHDGMTLFSDGRVVAVADGTLSLVRDAV